MKRLKSACSESASPRADSVGVPRRETFAGDVHWEATPGAGEAHVGDLLGFREALGDNIVDSLGECVNLGENMSFEEEDCPGDEDNPRNLELSLEVEDVKLIDAPPDVDVEGC